MPLAVDYGSFTDTRSHLKDVLDATAQGRTVTVRRDEQVTVVMPAEKLRQFFFQTVSPRVEIFKENGAAVAVMRNRPFVSEGADVADALADLILSLREYVADWEDRLQNAPNHASAWSLVQLVKLSTDEQLLEWFDRGGE